MPDGHQPLFLLSSVLVAVLILIVLIARCKVHAFIALTLVSFGVGLAAGMKLPAVAQAFQDGVGAMLGSVAIVVGLGMVLGRMLALSGGAEVIAERLITFLGPQRLHWTMMLVGFLVGIPVFFTVGLVLLVPVLMAIIKDGRQPMLYAAVPMLAGLSVVHGLVPPHPGPMAAIGITGANPGKTLLDALGIGFVAAVIAGPLLAPFLARRIQVKAVCKEDQFAGAPPPDRKRPGFLTALFTIILPVLLMLVTTAADLLLPKGTGLRAGLDLVGSPVAAMLIATLFSFYSFGLSKGLAASELLAAAEASLGPAGSILLVVGAGGGFNRVLVASGVGEAMATLAQSAHLSPILLGWVVAALIRIATGSATVAMTTAAGVVAPFAAKVPGTSLELVVIATGAGSLILSHVNDGGFWFVKEYLGLTVPQTLQSWTVLETVIAVVVLLLVLVVNYL
jgi:GntP family gluconate:H+ symporter